MLTASPSPSPSTAGTIAGPPAAVRTGASLVLAGAVAEYGVTTLHPHRAAPNDHAHAFAEYAASTGWTAVHLGQFLAGGVVLIGVLVLLAGLRSAGAPALVTRIGAALTVLAGGVLAVLQGVDGVALKHAVDSLAAAPPALHDVWLHDAQVVRWIEEAMAAYSRITLGLSLLALGAAVATSRGLPRWTAGAAVVSGVAFLIDGVVVSTAGFSDQVLASLVAWLALAVFALTSAAAAWHRR